MNNNWFTINSKYIIVISICLLHLFQRIAMLNHQTKQPPGAAHLRTWHHCSAVEGQLETPFPGGANNTPRGQGGEWIVPWWELEIGLEIVENHPIKKYSYGPKYQLPSGYLT